MSKALSRDRDNDRISANREVDMRYGEDMRKEGPLKTLVQPIFIIIQPLLAYDCVCTVCFKELAVSYG